MLGPLSLPQPTRITQGRFLHHPRLLRNSILVFLVSLPTVIQHRPYRWGARRAVDTQACKPVVASRIKWKYAPGFDPEPFP